MWAARANWIKISQTHNKYFQCYCIGINESCHSIDAPPPPPQYCHMVTATLGLPPTNKLKNHPLANLTKIWSYQKQDFFRFHLFRKLNSPENKFSDGSFFLIETSLPFGFVLRAWDMVILKILSTSVSNLYWNNWLFILGTIKLNFSIILLMALTSSFLSPSQYVIQVLCFFSDRGAGPRLCLVFFISSRSFSFASLMSFCNWTHSGAKPVSTMIWLILCVVKSV